MHAVDAQIYNTWLEARLDSGEGLFLPLKDLQAKDNDATLLSLEDIEIAKTQIDFQTSLQALDIVKNIFFETDYFAQTIPAIWFESYASAVKLREELGDTFYYFLLQGGLVLDGRVHIDDLQKFGGYSGQETAFFTSMATFWIDDGDQRALCAAVDYFRTATVFEKEVIKKEVIEEKKVPAPAPPIVIDAVVKKEIKPPVKPKPVIAASETKPKPVDKTEVVAVSEEDSPGSVVPSEPVREDPQALFKQARALGDTDEALELYLKAANLGHVNSQFAAGQLYEKRGNLTEAAAWYKKAAMKEHEQAGSALTRPKFAGY